MPDHYERFVQTVFSAAVDWRVSAGEIALALAGIILCLGLIGSVMLLRWIYAGGLSRFSRLGFHALSQHPVDWPPSYHTFDGAGRRRVEPGTSRVGGEEF